MLPKQYKLPASYFQDIYTKGYKCKGKFGMLIGLASKDTSDFKIGFVVNSKIGNSVQRHKMTRRLRSIFLDYVKKLQNPSPILLQYVLFSYTDDYKELEKDFNNCFDNLLKKIK